MSEEESEFWEAHLNIFSLFFDGNEIIIDCDKLPVTRALLEHLEADLAIINRVFTDEKFTTFKTNIVNLGF